MAIHILTSQTTIDQRMTIHPNTNLPRSCFKPTRLRSITQLLITGLNTKWTTIVEMGIITIKVYCNPLINRAYKSIQKKGWIYLWYKIINKVAIFIRKEIQHIKRARLYNLISLKCKQGLLKESIKNHKLSIEWKRTHNYCNIPQSIIRLNLILQ
jgi:hypothetical protein